MNYITTSFNHTYTEVDMSLTEGALWTANRHPELSQSDLLYAAIFMVTGGVFALIFTLYPVAIIMLDPQMHQTFCYILLSSGVANSLIVLIMMLYCVPAVIHLITRPTDDESTLFPGFLNSTMGGLFAYVYYAALLSHLLMSVNRICALIFPLKYSYYFRKTNMFKLIASIWIVLTPILLIISTQIFDCVYVYRAEFTIFSYGLSTCSDILSWVDLVISVGTVTLTTIFDLGVVFSLVQMGLKRKVNKRVEVELSFFIQTCLSGLVYMASSALYHFAGHSFRSQDMWRVFFFDQLPKLLTVLLLGIFTVTLQKRIRVSFNMHFQKVCGLVVSEAEEKEFAILISRIESSVGSQSRADDDSKKEE